VNQRSALFRSTIPLGSNPCARKNRLQYGSSATELELPGARLDDGCKHALFLRGGPIHSGDSCGTAEIMRQSGNAKPVVWRWQARFMAEGVAGLTRDKTRAVVARGEAVQELLQLASSPPRACSWRCQQMKRATRSLLKTLGGDDRKVVRAIAREARRSRATARGQSRPRLSEKATEVSNSYPHASQDQKLLTHRSLTYLESLTAIDAAWQLGQRWCAFSLIRFASIRCKDIHRTCRRSRALSRLPRQRQGCEACRTKPTTAQSIR
jgi:hypothetical protein